MLRGADAVNDQTYVLSRIGKEALQRTMFPLGELTKTEVKNIARQHSLDRILKKEESTGICFISSQHFKSFVSRVSLLHASLSISETDFVTSCDQYVLDRPGKVLDVDSGEIVGTHRGIHHWPIGQRYSPSYYVVGNDEKSTLFVVNKRFQVVMTKRVAICKYFAFISGTFENPSCILLSFFNIVLLSLDQRRVEK